jgi:tetratricopeptide (TPR) repeat protein
MAKVKEDAGLADEARSAAETALTAAMNIADNALILKAREVRAFCLIRQSLNPEALDELKILRDSYASETDSWSCARLDLEIGALLIRMKRYNEAETYTRSALSLFKELGDDYGNSLARRNLASILSESADNDKEVTALLAGFQVTTPLSGNLRERAWFCNLMIRKCRRSMEYSRAEEYGREAIAIGEKLGDIHLVALNRICLGNVYRDKQEYDKAFAEYYQAANEAQKTGDRSIEAASSHLIANVHNRRGETNLAIQYATHAIGLVHGTLATTELSDAYAELAKAYVKAHQDKDAAKAYLDAAAALKKSQYEEERFRLALEGLFIFVEHNMIHEYLDAINTLTDTKTVPTDALPPIERLYDAFWQLLSIAPHTHIIALCGLHFRLMFEGAPEKIGRHLFKKLSRELIDRAPDLQQDGWRVLLPILPLLVSVSPNTLRLSDIVDLADGLHKMRLGISFKPQHDGAAHWVLDLDLQTHLLFSITLFDNGVDTATAAMLLVLFLKGFEQSIREELTTAQQFPINELTIQILNTRSLPRDMDKYFKPAIEDEVCVVTRPTALAAQNVPTIVICREDIASNWKAGKRDGGSMQMLIGLTLTEIVYRLFEREVALESLRPKIVELVRKTMS